MSDRQNGGRPPAWPPPPTLIDNGQSVQHGAPFVSTSPLRRWFVRLVCATIVVDIIETGIDLASRKDGLYTSPEAALAIAGSILYLIALPTIVVYCIWTYRIVANLAVFGEEKVSAHPGWAVCYYFIPVLAFFRPYQIMQEAWRASDPTHYSSQQSVRGQEPRGSIVDWWWFCWLLYTVTAWILIVLSVSARGIADSLAVELGYTLIALTKNAVAIVFVSALTARQVEAYRRLISSAADR